MTEPVIRMAGLRKSYGAVEAIRGIDIEVAAGEVFAFLGPNGAGKTTTVEILEGYRDRTSGEVSVLGEDPGTAGRKWRERIGIVLQQSKMPPELSVRETLDLFAGYYREPRGVAETLELVGLGDKADTRVGRLSGGQQRRLDVALALVGDPQLLFLDEPTTGFDPSARRQAWEMIRSLRRLGKTVFLTTHYIEEAQHLADRVVILSRGRIVADGTPSELGNRADRPARISFRLPAAASVADLPPELGRPTADDGAVSVETRTPVVALNAVTAWALERGVDLEGLEVSRPTLEDVYIELTSEEAGP